MHGFSIIGMGE